jgi:hypothetical protein
VKGSLSAMAAAVVPKKRRGWIVLVVACATAIAVGLTPYRSTAASPTPDPLTNPSCYLSTGCGGGTSIPDYADGHSPVNNGTVGDMAALVPALAVGLAEDPISWTIPGLDLISLGTSAVYFSILVGSALDNVWYQGTVTDTMTGTACSAWKWKEMNGDPLGIGLSNAAYVHARCGIGNDDVYAGTPSGSPYSAAYGFYHYVLNSATIHHGAVYPVTATLCGGLSPCYVRADTVDHVLNRTGPFHTKTRGSSVSSGWADPWTGHGITQQADPYNGGPSSPNPQCTQGGVSMPCSSVDPNGPAVQPKDGLPNPWASDGYSNPEGNNLRCQLSPQAFGCPQVSTDDPSDWATTGGPKISMPNCYGLSQGACQGAVIAALSAAGSSVSPGFTTTGAPTYDPNIAIGAVAATISAAGMQTDATSVVEEINEEQQPAQECSAHMEYYHDSKHEGHMLSVFYVDRCNFSSPPNVLLNAMAWACTSEPSQDATMLAMNAWGCVPDASAFDVPVTANGYLKGSDAYLNGQLCDPTKWYIAYAYSNYDTPLVFPSWTQVLPPDSCRDG